MDPRLPDSDAPMSAFRDTGANLGGAERMLSLAGGSALGVWGLRRGGAVGIASGLLATALLARGLTGRAPVRRWAGPNRFERAVATREGWSSASVTVQTVTINAPRDMLYRFWRSFSNLPRFMENIERIDIIDDNRSHWVVKAPAGRTVEWDAIITADQPDRRIAWESAEGADVANSGWVEFRDAPSGRGTEVHAFIAYEPPGGTLGRMAAKLFQREPAIQARRDLKRLKMLMEAGEVATNAPQCLING
jgi:uncharacterized membrane protein